ncbi:MAG: hypothetical protein WC718_19355 [Phycisphaerales bacterium]|jgi:hypothetical protein
MKTLQGLVAEHFRKQDEAQLQIEAWHAGREQREAEAVRLFRAFMNEKEDIALGDIPITAGEWASDFPLIDPRYTITMSLPALGAYIATSFTVEGTAGRRFSDSSWQADVEGNHRGFEELLDALLWITHGEPLPADVTEPAQAWIELPVIQTEEVVA